ncbi:ribosome-inactivating protein [Xylariaceae sp. FL0594]|nr:ribosome-inactivating protein [Xylariaceae sp. FL0594]
MAESLTYTLGTSATEYDDFIKEFRKKLAKPNRYAKGVPVLIEQDDTRPNNLFEIRLETDTQKVKLSIRKDTLYLIGWRDETSSESIGPWLEIDSDRKKNNPRIPGSTWIGFHWDYKSLEGAAGLSQTRATLRLNQQVLQGAVNQLAKVRAPITGDKKTATARSLLVIMQMISESTRFIWITNYLKKIWNETKELDDGKQAFMIALETSWGALSEALIHADQNASRFKLSEPNDLNMATAEDAQQVMGIALNGSVPQATPSPSERQDLTTTASAGAWIDYPQGCALLEVFWVRIDRIDGKSTGSLYGTIKAIAALGTLELFNRPKSDAESFSPGGYVPLTGPSRCIPAADNLEIKLDLWDKRASPSTDQVITHQTLPWMTADARYPSDKTITQPVVGKAGSGVVHYMVSSNAGQALIEVILVSGDGKSTANIYGSITANNGFGDSELFNRDAKDNIAVKPKDPIPLRRIAVAVPLSKKLEIKAKLFEQHADPKPDGETANSSVSFSVDIMKSAQQSIRGKKGEIRVKVSWS